MSNWLILSKLSLIIYFVTLYINGSLIDSTNMIYSLLILLSYISLNMIVYIVKNLNLKRILLLVTIVILLSGYGFLNKELILLLPFSMFEFLVTFFKTRWIFIAITIVQIMIVDEKILNEHILISTLSLVIFLILVNKYEIINNLIKENDELREKNNNLCLRINRNAEYERQMIYMSQLEERNKIAQEIHDKIGHTIAGSLLQLEASKVLINNNVEKSLEIIQKVIDVLREGMEGIRITLRSIKPPVEQLGINRIKLLVNEYFKNSNINVKVIYTGNLDYINKSQWSVIFENTSEAATNVIKYAKATVITINIEILNKYIKCEIKDNGVGTVKLKRGLGIRGIEERTELAGGKVIIDSSNGFSIITLLPIKED
jgi:signal transduction histidine kinase